ncbi:MAG: family 16 glycosylhydrolase, partial [Anaerohalosphaeraceae bacterium]
LASPDIDGNDTVDLVDYGSFSGSWLSATNTYDINGDGVFDTADLIYIANEWLRTPADYVGYTLVWSDEFDGTEIDHSNWQHEVGDSWYNNELQSYTPRPHNSYVADGDLVIVALNESYGGNQFTSARMITRSKADFKYGRIEARMKLPGGGGMWPAFWMMPTHSLYGSWAASGEIDIMEAANTPTWIAGNIHFGGESPLNNSSGSTKYYGGGEDFSQDYHVYSLEWDPTEIRWFCDGNWYKTETNWWTGSYSDNSTFPAPFDEEFYIILNVAVGGNYPGCLDPSCITATFPQEMRVDYVRVYQ